MKHVIDPSKQKFVIAALAVGATALGLAAASRAIFAYQIGEFLKISLYVYIFLVVLENLVFDLHLRPVRTVGALERSFFAAIRERFHYMGERRHFLHFQNYLVLPSIIYWATVALLFLSPFENTIKQILILASTLALGISFWYLKTVFYAHHEASRGKRQLLFIAKLYATFLAMSASLGISRYFGHEVLWFALLVFAISFLLMYQALFQHNYSGFKAVKFLLVSSISLGTIGYFVYIYWSVNYFSGALLLTAVYNAFWGIIHHRYIDQNLTRELVYEYLAVLFVIVVILLGGTNFGERI